MLPNSDPETGYSTQLGEYSTQLGTSEGTFLELTDARGGHLGYD